MNKKKAVVFDFDGTLSNSFPLVAGKITEAIAMFRKEELTEEENNSIYGPTELTKFNAFKYFKAIYTGGLYGEVKEELLNELASIHHYNKEDLVYIGDSLHDVPQCRRANVDIISVSYANTDSYEKLEEINKGNVAKTVEELKAKLLEIL